MKKKIGLITTGLSILLLSGCDTVGDVIGNINEDVLTSSSLCVRKVL